MTDEQIEAHAREECAEEIKTLIANGWKECDVDFDDHEVRIVFDHKKKPDMSVQVMYQPPYDEDEDED